MEEREGGREGGRKYCYFCFKTLRMYTYNVFLILLIKPIVLMYSLNIKSNSFLALPIIHYYLIRPQLPLIRITNTFKIEFFISISNVLCLSEIIPFTSCSKYTVFC